MQQGSAETAHESVLILDFGSQYTQLIARRIREQGVFCEIRPCTLKAPEVLAPNIKGLILSGGPDSVLEDSAPPFDPNWLNVDIPLLGVCYGMQLLTHLGGYTTPATTLCRFLGCILNSLTVSRAVSSPVLFGICGSSASSHPDVHVGMRLMILHC